MKKLTTVVAAGLLAAGVFSATAGAAGAIVGYISDQKCAMDGSKASTAAEWIKPAAFESCVKDCMKAQGAEAVFVTEDNKILTFDAASKKKIEEFLGHKVSVTGKVEGSTIKIDTITAVKMK